MQSYTKYASVSGWNAIQDDKGRCDEKTLSENKHVRFAVVGAGFAGAATARRLAELYPDEEIILLDALPAGEGSAGRSSGFMLDRADTKIDARSTGPQANWQTEILQAGMESLRLAVAEQNIQCDWDDIGHYKTATTQRGARELDELLLRLDSTNSPYRRLTPENIQTEMGTQHCTNAAWFPSCVLVQPAKLIHGLLRTLPKQVQLYTNSPVHRLVKGNPNILSVGRYQVKADTVILCNNVSLPFFNYGGSRQLPVYTYAGMTPELDDTELIKLGDGGNWGATPTERLGPTTRKLRSKRFLFRAGFSYKKELPPEQIRALLREMYGERYPQMKSHSFEYVWGGALSMTRNGAPIFKKIDTNIYALSACNASGILKMTALGKLMAESIAGHKSILLQNTEQFSNPTWIPPEPLRRLAVNYSFSQMKKAMRD